MPCRYSPKFFAMKVAYVKHIKRIQITQFMQEQVLNPVVQEAVSLKMRHSALISGSATAVRLGQCCEINGKLRNLLRGLSSGDRILYIHQVNRERMLDPDLDGVACAIHEKPCPCGRMLP
jgi:hypothetical protein